MSKRIREPFGKAGLTVAIVALVTALAGGAIAAENAGDDATASAKKKNRKGKAGGLNAKQKRQVIALAKRFVGQGPQGIPGLPGAAGAAGDDGSDGDDGQNGQSVTLAAATGCTEGGTKLSVGGESQEVCNGEEGLEGLPGEDGTFSTEPLPEGETLTGTWAFGFSASGELEGEEGTLVQAPISFPIQVEPAPSPKYVTLGQQEGETVNPECTVEGVEGSAANPLAAPGTLCVYEGIMSESPLLANVSSPSSPSSGAPGADPSGAFVQLLYFTSSPPFGSGTWAVTAPLAP